MPHKDDLHKQLIQKTSLGLLAGLAVWMGLLVASSVQFRGQHEMIYNVRIGPLVTNVLRQEKTADGFRATITFEPGLLWLVVTCGCSGLLAGICSYQAKRRS